MSYKEKLDIGKIPVHVAIIMDGNGRWAAERGLERTEGHRAGVAAVRKTVEAAVKLGIKYITLYTFSTENWRRPASEIKALMQLLMDNIGDKIFMDNNVRLRVIGDMSRLPLPVSIAVKALISKTENNKGTCVVLALSYSSRQEITQTVKDIALKVKSGLIAAEDITEDLISRNLSTNFMPDPELLIRTSGEQRISNYLLWQISYSELYFTPVYWPDFNEEELCHAIYDFQNRERRFGKTSKQIAENK